MVKTPSFHCRRPGFDPSARELGSQRPCGLTKKKKKERERERDVLIKKLSSGDFFLVSLSAKPTLLNTAL